jgi:hypothetical protein
MAIVARQRGLWGGGEITKVVLFYVVLDESTICRNLNQYRGQCPVILP